ncbi:sterol desaturase family protein [Sphingomonas sp. MS122]|uniref:sterol desaturase family protein n=1 Tax=Sphingomonas sp. MS122 TaxID=3412683 RepID=UPI003C2C4EE1
MFEPMAAGGLSARGWRSRPLLWRATLWACFALIVAVAWGLVAAGPILDGWARALSSGVKADLLTGGPRGYVEAGLGTAAWFALLVGRPLAILAVVMAVEIALVGPPRSWSRSCFFMLMQAIIASLFYFLNPWLQMVLPVGELGALVRVEMQHLPALLAPLGNFFLIVLVFLLHGLAGYWVHRAQHEIPFLWRFHAVHHAIEDMEAMGDVSHPFDAIGDRIGVILIGLLVGVNYEGIAWIIAVRSGAGRLIHSRAPINFGKLGWLFVDNRFHFTHHSVREKYFDRNYGGVFTIYDRLFGTYVAPDGDALEVTGMPSKLPARTVTQFLLARLDDRPAAPAETR